jgi:hypothetical protein
LLEGFFITITAVLRCAGFSNKKKFSHNKFSSLFTSWFFSIFLPVPLLFTNPVYFFIGIKVFYTKTMSRRTRATTIRVLKPKLVWCLHCFQTSMKTSMRPVAGPSKSTVTLTPSDPSCVDSVPGGMRCAYAYISPTLFVSKVMLTS